MRPFSMSFARSIACVVALVGLVVGAPIPSGAGPVEPTEPPSYDPGLPVESVDSTAPPSPVDAPSRALVREPAGSVGSPPSEPTVAPRPVPGGTNAPGGATVSGVLPGESKPAGPEGLDDKHRLAVGDRISFRIVEDEEDPKSLVVADSGEVEVPYLGRWGALEKTCKGLAAELKVELEKEYYYQATVVVSLDLRARSRGKIYLVGPVRAPGPQEIPSDEALTISKAILRAGGFLESADKKNVRVTRKKTSGGGEEVLTVNVSDILEKGKTDGDIALQVGDLIYIPERLIRF